MAVTGQLALDLLHNLPWRYRDWLQTKAPLLIPFLMPLEERQNFDVIAVPASEPLLHSPPPFPKPSLLALIRTRTTRNYGTVYSGLDRRLAKVPLGWTIM